MKSNKIMGRDVARKRNPEETFSDAEIANNQHRFREIEEILKLDDTDSGFFDELVLLIGDCRGFDALWSEAPRRKAVRAELKALQRAFRQQPDELQNHLSQLSLQATYCLNAVGQIEDTPLSEIKNAIHTAIKNTPADEGGPAAKQGIRFLVGQFAKLYEKETKIRPALTYDAYKELHSGRFLLALELVSALVWAAPPTRETLAYAFKLLFYKSKK